MNFSKSFILVLVMAGVIQGQEDSWDHFWTDMTYNGQLVPDRFERPPGGKAFVLFPSGVLPIPDDTLSTGQVNPELST
jgi:hypothetical protein